MAWKSNDLKQIVENTLSNIDFWEEDLTKINSLTEDLILALTEIEVNGIENGFSNFKSKKE